MNTLLHFATRFAAPFLVALSAIGFIAAAQQYFAVDTIAEAALSQRTLEESFVVMLKTRIPLDSNTIRQAIDDEDQQLQQIHSSTSRLIEVVQRRQLWSAALWVVVFVASAVWLMAARRRP